MHAHVLGTTTSRKIAAPDPEVRRRVEGDTLTLNLRRGARALPCWNHVRDPRWYLLIVCMVASQAGMLSVQNKLSFLDSMKRAKLAYNAATG
jgi:hypothetical protein